MSKYALGPFLPLLPPPPPEGLCDDSGKKESRVCSTLEVVSGSSAEVGSVRNENGPTVGVSPSSFRQASHPLPAQRERGLAISHRASKKERSEREKKKEPVPSSKMTSAPCPNPFPLAKAIAKAIL